MLLQPLYYFKYNTMKNNHKGMVIRFDYFYQNLVKKICSYMRVVPMIP